MYDKAAKLCRMKSEVTSMADKKIIDAMWDDSPVDVSTEVNFIWSIANKLRGTYQSDKYKDVIIPMVIIRRFECALAPTKAKVVETYKANPNYPAKAMYRLSGFQFYNTVSLILQSWSTTPTTWRPTLRHTSRASLPIFRILSAAWILTSRSTRWTRTIGCSLW